MNEHSITYKRIFSSKSARNSFSTATPFRQWRRWTRFSCGIFCKMRAEQFRKAKVEPSLLTCAYFCVITTAFLVGQETTMNHPQQTFAGYPPSVYAGFFQACSSNKACTRTEDFHVDPVPKGCCIL